MTTPCSDVTQALGSYVVGAIDAHDRAEVEAHLAGCPRCRDELASLAALPGLMSRLSLDEVLLGPPAIDDALLERLLATAARERRVARHRRLLAAVAAAALVAGGTVGGIAAYDAATRPHWPAVSATAGPVHMRVEMARVATGTALTLTLSGVPSEERCRLVAVSDTGTREVAGSWEASYTGTAWIKGTTSIPYRHIAQLVVETDSGRQLAAVRV